MHIQGELPSIQSHGLKLTRCASAVVFIVGGNNNGAA
jgi:hypothetical protein